MLAYQICESGCNEIGYLSTFNLDKYSRAFVFFFLSDFRLPNLYSLVLCEVSDWNCKEKSF